MIPIHFAPLQGYTDDVYRRLHHQLIGGVDCYYTPFLRIEGGGVRSKDMRDIEPAYNEGVPVVPQIIMKSRKEFDFLVNVVEEKGYKEIDLNMGCPFPMQAKHGRGSGLLAHLEVVDEIVQAIRQKTDLTFSVKMRLGWEEKEEWRPVLERLNEIPLKQITLHPRVGKQQYKGEVDREAFEAFYELCKHPLLYNGDVLTVEDIQRLETAYPRLAGVMIGRGLLARPSLAAEYKEGRERPWQERCRQLMEMHEQLKSHFEGIVNSDAQLHSKLRLFWEYMESEIERKAYKKIMKSGNLKNYLAAVQELARK
ncbi:MAG: tRNA-dihydrouridine synthase family protein [Parabacteroides sp.]|nr:tRNA-dihydrouridine synthase family protein [Parabacteroides sp.]